ncbi:MAG TPA: antitoxin Xre/MbcA/ParS toxin-binding domain-containing protein, partial [Pyrinomonadaceae bacterium]|nr:antitoxin Xre/MbcA/ParS toxin-binding domain-containing protein [Pyrinomonadaceae bacterium]
SDRLLRISRIFALSIELFEGNIEDARRWLLSSQKALGNKTPFAMSKTEIGAREVENLIGRLEHGVFT